jgi:hypothetical protein
MDPDIEQLLAGSESDDNEAEDNEVDLVRDKTDARVTLRLHFTNGCVSFVCITWK